VSGLDAMSEAEAAAVSAHLAAYVAARRWFRGKARRVAQCTLADSLPLPAEGETARARAWFAIVRVAYTDGGSEESEDYVLPMLRATPDEAERLRREHRHLVVANLADGGAIVDALGDERFLRLLPRLLERGEILREGGSALGFRRVARDVPLGDAAPRPLNAEQSNTSIAYGDAYILKVIRKLEEGVSADLEMGEFLTRAGYAHAPAVLGAVELARNGRPPGTVAILHAFVPNRGDAWSFFQERLEAFLDRLSNGGDVGTPAGSLGEDRARVELLATRVAEMHLALGSRPDVPAFAPEPITGGERARLAGAVGASWRNALASLGSQAGSLPPDAARLVTELAGRDAAVSAALSRFVDSTIAAEKIRIHGDLHLGQVLVTDEDFVLIDFEGEPARPLSERKAKRSPLADVAGMLSSLHYATVSAARAHGLAHVKDASESERAMLAWHAEAREAFLGADFAAVRGASFLPPSDAEARSMLDFYVLEKCLYEVHYELNNRPDWVAIPLEGLAQLAQLQRGPRAS
jgi:trehalose synthase-fused probable maltokinase